MEIKNNRQDKLRSNEHHDKEGKIRHFKDGYVDSTGHKQTSFFLEKHMKNDHDECIRDIEEYMIRYCEKNSIDYRFVDKLSLLKKLSSSMYKTYINSHYRQERL